MTRLVGVTGKTCSGKNTVARELERRLGPSIDVDLLGHEVLDRNIARVEEVFGPSVALPDGRADRKAIAQIVFNNPAKLKALEGILHPAMVRRVREIQKGSGERFLIVNAAILARMGLDRLCCAVVFVKAPHETRFRRAKARDGLSREAFAARCRSQKDVTSANIAPGRPVYVVNNCAGSNKFNRQVAKICGKLLKK